MFGTPLPGTHNYFPDPKSIEPLLADMAAVGFGYVPHPGQDHGISAATAHWLTRTVMELGARVVTFSEHAWDGHQTVPRISESLKRRYFVAIGDGSMKLCGLSPAQQYKNRSVRHPPNLIWPELLNPLPV